MSNNDTITIDDKKVKNILRKIIIEERRNVSSKEISDSEMVKKIIEEEVECY